MSTPQTSLLELLPLFQETPLSIRARIDADLNSGVDPSDPAFFDTVEGSNYYDITQPIVLELARLYDALGSEYVASTLVLFAWGEWLDYHAATVNLIRNGSTRASGEVTFTGPVGTLIATGTRVSPTQSDPDVSPPEFVTTESGVIPGGGTLTLAVEAVDPGVAGNVPPGAITLLLSPVADGAVTAVTNTAATSDGLEEETDESLRERILLEYSQPKGPGNQADYIRWARAYPGVRHAKVEAIWAGPGTVRVTITGEDNGPVGGSTVTGLQDQLDPIPQQGAGTAPIGALVTVITPSLLTVNVSGAVTFLSGYSLDGTAGTIAVRTALETSIRGYIDTLEPGDEVILQHVIASFFSVEGVYDVSSVLLNGVAANVAVAGNQVARSGTVVLT